MRKIDKFTNQYPLSKTLRFRLIPQGKTEENFDTMEMLQEDEQRAEDYGKVKGMIDRYHKKFIEDSLKGLKLALVKDYAELYLKNKREPKDNKELNTISDEMRKQIAENFTKQSEYKGLFDKKIICDYLPNFVEPDELEALNSFSKFTTYFRGFHTNRENMYTGEGKASEIAFRIVDQNLPIFLDNTKIGKNALASLPENNIKSLEAVYAEVFGIDIHKIFEVEYFNSVLMQSGIDEYNQIIGGFTTSDGTKVKGVNEFINEYNSVSEKRIPKLKTLKKQILSDRSSISYLPEKFSSDNEVLSAIKEFCCDKSEENDKTGLQMIQEICGILNELPNQDINGIFIKNGSAISNISNVVFGSWNSIQLALNDAYDLEEMRKPPKNIEKYEETRRDYFKKIESYSIADLQKAEEKYAEAGLDITIAEYIASESKRLLDFIDISYKNSENLLTNPYPKDKKLCANDSDISIIKDLLDSIKELQDFARMLLGSGKEENKNDLFYGEFLPLYERLERIIPLYNKVRNYVTQKPYSNEKIKLNFNNVQLLGGWDKNKEPDCAGLLFKKDETYFIGIMTKECNDSFENIPEVKTGEETYSKMIYKQLQTPHMNLPRIFFSKKGVERDKPNEEILKIYKKGTFKSGKDFNLSDCHTLIDYYKSVMIGYPGWDVFNFEFPSTESYSNIKQFYDDIEKQGYNLSFCNVPASYIDELVDDGRLFLFKIYSKDFSPYSKGTPNLHTLYFKMLFDELNLKNITYSLNGGAEIFCRKPSITDGNTVHPAGIPIKNKNPINEKHESIFDYDIIKDRRYTQRQFFFHVPITLNFKAENNKNINFAVRQELRRCDDNYVIGIDRGERNLIYVCVIDGSGKIVEQFSMNTIDNSKHTVDYHSLLDSREKSRTKARQDWQTIQNIRDIKEGYLSQVVHRICRLIEKYDAVVAMEDLNSGFKNSRIKVEKQVYQKFEKALVDKLNFYLDKRKNPDEVGGLLNAYQLTAELKNVRSIGRQNGFIFYIPPWLTSKIDPTSGFVDLLKPRYTSVTASKDFFYKFDRISYNAEKDYFEFEFNYANFDKGSTDYRGNWTLASHGKRIRTYRNPSKNSQWDNELIDLTSQFKALFEKAGFDLSASNLKTQIVNQSKKEFFVELIKLMSLMLQMRNSISGTDVDYLISPVMNSQGKFYCSNEYVGIDAELPADADANGAYHIAKKAQWAIEQIKNSDEENLAKVNISITNAEWLRYIQSQFI